MGNLRWYVEDSVTTEYQTIITAAHSLRTNNDRQQLWSKYMEMHIAIERIMLDLCVLWVGAFTKKIVCGFIF